MQRIDEVPSKYRVTGLGKENLRRRPPCFLRPLTNSSQTLAHIIYHTDESFPASPHGALAINIRILFLT